MNAKSIFAEALERSDPAARSAFLAQACGDDAELRSQVEALLHAYEEAGSFMDQPVATSDVGPGQWLNADGAPSAPLEGVGSRIQHYKLLQQIGEGGMGVVFMAEQQEPVKRMVALKVIKAGMDSAQVIARFEQERQALALMDHPNIATVLDAGTTASGRPYFVMELVKGIPIAKYCDEQRLTPKQRLELFVPVCQAIQHAHQKGIIHRDIKPSNVLIAAYDGRPVPKVIDFGVAKATGAKLTERTLFTGFGGIIGTLEYMSPEQAEFNALDVDTRSDIYSLGVLLYELLTGTTPLSRQRIQEAAMLEVLRLIREEEPPRPSTRISESKDLLASVSAHRQLEPTALVKAVRGEVDWIVMKALEKDRTRRYDTANGLARDIQRYLSEEPVEAGPPSATYRLRKLAWKHRRGLSLAALLLALIVVAAGVSIGLAMWALREQRLAQQRLNEATAQKERAEKAETEAKGNEAKAKQSEENSNAVLKFFQDKLLSAGRPKGQEGGLGRDVKLIEAVNRAREAIGDSFADRPLVEASIRGTLGETYRFLGDYSQAIRQNERALALSEGKLGPDHRHTAFFRNNLALGYGSAGRTADAIRLHEQTLKQAEVQLGFDHSDTLRSRNNLAIAYHAAGRITEAIRLHEQNLKQREAKFGPDHPDTLVSRLNLAAAYHAAGRTAEAIGLLEPTLKQHEAKLGADHPDTLHTRSSLASAYRSAGRIADAIRLLEPTLPQREAKLGADHPETLNSRNHLALAYLDAGRTPEAIALLEPTVPLAKAKLGADHPITLRCRNNLASAYWRAGRLAEAIDLHEQNLRQQEATLGLDHPDSLTSRHNLALAYNAAGRSREAIHLLEQTLKQREAKLGADHPATLSTRNGLIGAYNSARQFTKAEPLARTALEDSRRRFGADDPRTARRMAALGLNLLFQHNYAEAELQLRDCLKIRQAKEPDAWNTFNTQSMLGEALLGQKKYADAEPLLRNGYEGMKQREANIPPQGKRLLTPALRRLVRLYEATGKKDEAAKWRKELTTSGKK